MFNINFKHIDVQHRVGIVHNYYQYAKNRFQRSMSNMDFDYDEMLKLIRLLIQQNKF